MAGHVLFQDLNLVVDQRRALGNHRAQRQRQDHLVPAHHRGQDPTRGVVSAGGGLRVTMLDQHREFPGSRNGVGRRSLALRRAGGAGAPAADSCRADRRAGGACTGGLLAPLRPRPRAIPARRWLRDRRPGRRRAPRPRLRSRPGADPAARHPERRRARPAGPGPPARRARPTSCCSTSPPTTSTSRPRAGSRATCASLTRAVSCREPRPRLPRRGRGPRAAPRGRHRDRLRRRLRRIRRQRAERRLASSAPSTSSRKVIAAEEDFIRRNIAGQDTTQAKGRRRRLARLPRLSPPPGDEESMALRFDVRRPGRRPGAGGGQRCASTVEDRMLLDEFSSRHPAGRCGRAGRTQRRRQVDAARRPCSASGRLPGRSARIGDVDPVAYYRQDLAQVPHDKTLFDIIDDLRPPWTRGQVQGHLGRFDFSGDEVLRRAGTLSGGERARVALAMMMLEGANLLVFDEPTNHLDVESIEALEDAIEELRRHRAAGEPRPGPAANPYHQGLGARGRTHRWILRVDSRTGRQAKADRARAAAGNAKGSGATAKRAMQPVRSSSTPSSSVTRTARRKAEAGRGRGLMPWRSASASSRSGALGLLHSTPTPAASRYARQELSRRSWRLPAAELEQCIRGVDQGS